MNNYNKDFQYIKIKDGKNSRKFDLSDPVERKRYFQKKAGREIKLLNQFFKNNTFIAYFLGKKNAGKGTYTKLMMEIFGEDKIGHISVGDIIRTVHQDMSNEGRKKNLLGYLKKNYRGYISIEGSIDALLNRDTKSLLPTEFILILLKREIDKLKKKTLFVDGFPRDLNQVSYSLFFRDLINYRDDPDIFIAIDVPESIINARMKSRVVCPVCHAPRSLQLLPTKEVEYDEKQDKLYLICDNPKCKKARMVEKEGDELGIEAVRGRLKSDEELIKKVFLLHGFPKILVRNSIPVDIARRYVDDYEITPAYSYQINPKTKKIRRIEGPWIVKDDEGKEVCSLLAPAVIVTLIKQLPMAIGLDNKKGK